MNINESVIFGQKRPSPLNQGNLLSIAGMQKLHAILQKLRSFPHKLRYYRFWGCYKYAIWMVWLEIAVPSVTGKAKVYLLWLGKSRLGKWKDKREAGSHVPNRLREVQGPNLTQGCSRGLQTTPFRNCDSGLPKEAYIDMSNFCANQKMAISGNLKAKLPTFWTCSTETDEKTDIISSNSRKLSKITEY